MKIVLELVLLGMILNSCCVLSLFRIGTSIGNGNDLNSCHLLSFKNWEPGINLLSCDKVLGRNLNLKTFDSNGGDDYDQDYDD